MLSLLGVNVWPVFQLPTEHDQPHNSQQDIVNEADSLKLILFREPENEDQFS